MFPLSDETIILVFLFGPLFEFGKKLGTSCSITLLTFGWYEKSILGKLSNPSELNFIIDWPSGERFLIQLSFGWSFLCSKAKCLIILYMNAGGAFVLNFPLVMYDLQYRYPAFSRALLRL